ncbi:HBR265Cp [Eremothecium sinecaudum]|uniref:HBR265Cp n=1 Tax=Eremothecium sinecaudum TaxID=45286 RepID=A0A109UX45_9SACH|nr:HBR265Cp [Eremothecium sinecaudum]AMD19166.1 HBR265Cp [Eremothecium sinecaudum]
MFLRRRFYNRFQCIRWSSSITQPQNVIKLIDSWDLNKWSSEIQGQALTEFLNHHLYKKESLHLISMLRNKLMRKYSHRLRHLLESYMSTIKDDLLRAIVCMALHRPKAPIQYRFFVSALNSIIESDISKEMKLEKIYYTIQLQNRLYPTFSAEKGILVPDDIHRWVCKALNNSFSDYYYFLINNNVLLNSNFAVQMMNRLLKYGSELDYQLASFQIFLHDERHHHLFHEKFKLLYNFKTMNAILNYMIERKDFRFIKIYFEALVARLESETFPKEASKSERASNSEAYIKTLMLFARVSKNEDLFLDSLILLFEKYSDGEKKSILTYEILLHVFSYLRNINCPEHILKITKALHMLPVATNATSNAAKHLLGSITTTIRSLGNPKLTASFICKGYNSASTKHILNELGLWSVVFHGKVEIVPTSTMNSNEELSKILPVIVPRSLVLETIPDNCALSELYRSVLEFYGNTLPKKDFYELIVQLCGLFKAFVTKSEARDKIYQLDASVLRLIMYQVRYTLNEPRLAFELLMEFYKDKNMTLETTRDNNPFGIMMYKNQSISHSEINQVLSIMEKRDIPLDYKTISAIIIKFITVGNIPEAHNWYLKLLHGNCKINSFNILVEAVRNKWELPADIDESLIQQVRNSSQSSSNSIPDIYEDQYLQDDEVYGFADTLTMEMTKLLSLTSSKEDPVNTN